MTAAEATAKPLSRLWSQADAATGQAEPKPRRHKWGSKVVVSPYKSERECENGCGIVKVTRHEHNSHWVEYWRGLDRIDVIRTPVCELVDQGVNA